MIAVDLSKQQALDSDPRANQQIYFTANLEQNLKHKFLTNFKHKNLFHSLRSRRNQTRLFTRNCKSIVNMLLNYF